jgi:hypothetical protein
MIAGREPINDRRTNRAVEAMVDAMISTPGLTAHEMAAAGLRLAHRVCRQTLECSSDGARLQNEEILRQCLQDMLLSLVDARGRIQ